MPTTEQVQFRVTFSNGDILVISAIHDPESLAIIPFAFDPKISIDWTQVERVEWI